jgi:hypothetical protein
MPFLFLNANQRSVSYRIKAPGPLSMIIIVYFFPPFLLASLILDKTKAELKYCQ